MTCLFYSTKKFFFVHSAIQFNWEIIICTFSSTRTAMIIIIFFWHIYFADLKWKKIFFFFHFILLFFSISPTLTQFPDYLYQTQIGIVRIDIYIFIYFHINTSCVNFVWFSYTQHTHTVISNQNKKKTWSTVSLLYIHYILQWKSWIILHWMIGLPESLILSYINIKINSG